MNTNATHTSGLEARISARRTKLIHSELAHIVREGVIDGWTSLGHMGKRKLDHWLAESQPKRNEREDDILAVLNNDSTNTGEAPA
jgi:hypothetical protein